MPRLSSLLDTRIVHCGGFEAAMIRAERTKGFFGYTGDALVEIRRFRQQTGREIVPLTVNEILEDEIAMRML